MSKDYQSLKYIIIKKPFLLRRSSPCVFGDCNDGISMYSCLCNEGYTGTNCDVMINYCESSPCKNGGTCATDGPLKYRCICALGYEGDMCQTDIDECEFIE